MAVRRDDAEAILGEAIANEEDSASRFDQLEKYISVMASIVIIPKDVQAFYEKNNFAKILLAGLTLRAQHICMQI